MRNKAVLFCRVSSKEQELEGYSLPAQEKLLKDYCIAQGIEVVKLFAISESAGAGKQRKIFNEMLSYLLKTGLANLVVEKTDRLTRNHSDAVSVNNWVERDDQRKVHFVKENFTLHKNSKSNEKFIWNIKVSVAQYYLDNLSEEVRKGQKEKLAQGRLPTKPPLGYTTVGEKGRRIHVIDDKTKHLAVNTFKYYATGAFSLKRLEKKLYEEGLRSVNGKKVPKSRIHVYLHDPFYIGFNKWNDKLYPGKQEIFIEKAIFDHVQTLLSGKGTPKYRKHNHLLRSICKCGECEGTIVWEKKKGTVYGRCNHHKECSQKTCAKEPEVEKILIKGLSNLQVKNVRLMNWIRKALKESHKDETDYYQSLVEDINTKETRLKTRLSNLYDDKVDGKITEAFYNLKYSEYIQERDEIDSLRSKCRNKDETFYELGSALYDLAHKSSQIYSQSKDAERKKKLLHMVYRDLIVKNGKLQSFTYTKPFQLLYEAAQMTNRSKLMENDHTASRILELTSFADMAGNNERVFARCSNWLPRVDSNHEP